jgi:hypothetical protein
MMQWLKKRLMAWELAGDITEDLFFSLLDYAWQKIIGQTR